VDVQTGQALANLAAAAMTTADLYDEQRSQRNAAESARRQAAFPADATAKRCQPWRDSPKLRTGAPWR